MKTPDFRSGIQKKAEVKLQSVGKTIRKSAGTLKKELAKPNAFDIKGIYKKK